MLVVRNPDTYGKSWELLQHAKELVLRSITEAKRETLLGTDVTVEEDGYKENYNGGHHPAGSLVLANYVRCVAGAFHNIAGTLYQADRISHAIRFLNEGCELGRRALVMHHRCLRFGSVPKEDEKERDVEGWRQLEEQLWRRWEILGVCQAKIGDRRVCWPSHFPTSYDLFRCHSSHVMHSGNASGRSLSARFHLRNYCEHPPLRQSLRDRQF